MKNFKNIILKNKFLYKNIILTAILAVGLCNINLKAMEPDPSEINTSSSNNPNEINTNLNNNIVAKILPDKDQIIKAILDFKEKAANLQLMHVNNNPLLNKLKEHIKKCKEISRIIKNELGSRAAKNPNEDGEDKKIKFYIRISMLLIDKTLKDCGTIENDLVMLEDMLDGINDNRLNNILNYNNKDINELINSPTVQEDCLFLKNCINTLSEGVLVLGSKYVGMRNLDGMKNLDVSKKEMLEEVEEAIDSLRNKTRQLLGEEVDKGKHIFSYDKLTSLNDLCSELEKEIYATMDYYFAIVSRIVEITNSDYAGPIVSLELFIKRY